MQGLVNMVDRGKCSNLIFQAVLLLFWAKFIKIRFITHQTRHPFCIYFSELIFATTLWTVLCPILMLKGSRSTIFLREKLQSLSIILWTASTIRYPIEFFVLDICMAFNKVCLLSVHHLYYCSIHIFHKATSTVDEF